MLNGIMVALLAQGLSVQQTRMIGMYEHARAGEIAEEKYGKRGTCSGDITKSIKYVWRGLE